MDAIVQSPKDKLKIFIILAVLSFNETVRLLFRNKRIEKAAVFQNLIIIIVIIKLFERKIFVPERINKMEKKTGQPTH